MVNDEDANLEQIRRGLDDRLATLPRNQPELAESACRGADRVITMKVCYP